MQHSRFVTGLSLAALLLAAATNGEARIASSIVQKMDRLMTVGRHLAPQGRDRQRAIGVSPSTREAILQRRAAQESRTLALLREQPLLPHQPPSDGLRRRVSALSIRRVLGYVR
jgi:hypothetical protein